MLFKKHTKAIDLDVDSFFFVNAGSDPNSMCNENSSFFPSLIIRFALEESRFKVVSHLIYFLIKITNLLCQRNHQFVLLLLD